MIQTKYRVCVLLLGLWVLFAVINNNIRADTSSNEISIPSLLAENPAFDFGTVFDGAVIRHTYHIKNIGKQAYRLLRVHTGCGCATASFSNEILPGQTGTVVVDSDTSGYAGRRFLRNINVFTDDPLHQEIQLRVSGQVKSFARIDPPNIQLTGSAGSVVRAEVSIIPRAENPFNITEIIPQEHENFVLTLEKQNQGYILLAENRMQQNGRYYETIVIKTDSPQKPEFTIRLIGRIEGDKPKLRPFGLPQ